MKGAPKQEGFDRELAGLPEGLRWREWMWRIEAAIFASTTPLSRTDLAGLVGAACVLDDLIGDIRAELKDRPYDLVEVAGGWQHRTRPRMAVVIRSFAAQVADNAGLGPLTPTELRLLAAIASEQPVSRAALSLSTGHNVSRDALALLKRRGLVANGPRLPLPGAPATYVTTRSFLETFGLKSLRDLDAEFPVGEADASMHGT